MIRTPSLIAVLVLSFAFIAQAHATSHWRTGGYIGAGIGLGGGAGISYAACHLAEENASSCRKTAPILGAIVLGAVGFGIGAGLGSLFKKNPPTTTSDKHTKQINASAMISPTLWVDPHTQAYGAGASFSF